MPRPELPYVYKAGTENAEGSNHRFRVGFGTVPVASRFGLSVIGLFNVELSPKTGVKAGPLIKLRIELMLQPDIKVLVTRSI
jgi:hypothetical protein